MWKVTAYFALGTVLCLAGSLAARHQAVAAEGETDPPAATAESRFWWAVAAGLLAYAAGCATLVWVRADGEREDVGRDSGLR